MINQLKMIKLVIMRLRSVPVSREKLVLGYQGTTQKWVSLLPTRYSGQPYLTEEVWSAFVHVNRGKLSVE
jgi:hypothetical protein